MAVSCTNHLSVIGCLPCQSLAPTTHQSGKLVATDEAVHGVAELRHDSRVGRQEVAHAHVLVAAEQPTCRQREVQAHLVIVLPRAAPVERQTDTADCERRCPSDRVRFAMSLLGALCAWGSACVKTDRGIGG
jgi:hypothetical protein